MNAIILFVLITELICMICIFNRVSNMKSLVDKIADGVKDLYLQIDRATSDIHLVHRKTFDILQEIESVHLDTSLLIKRFNNIAEEHKKKEQEELEKKNDHVKRVVERVKSVLYPYAPNMWQYVYEERKDRNRHKFTIMCSTTEDIITPVRNAFYNSGVEWSERRDDWEREWTIYIYDAE